MSLVELHNSRTGTERRPILARAPYDFRAEALETDGNCTDIARFPYNLRTVSVRIYPGLPPEAP